MTFGSTLLESTRRRGPLCVGIDPHPGLMNAWGLTDSVKGLERFALTSAEVLGATVAVVKPQSAFFERHGAAGIAVLERVVAECRQRGALVLLDVKRGDIGSTAQAYAEAYLHPKSPMSVDAITASPYLGMGSLDPMVDLALAHDRGVFVLAMTSNPEASQVQSARTLEGPTVAESVLAAVAARNGAGKGPGSVGVVVGATIDPPAGSLDVGGPVLVPGIGAQGGTLEDVRRIFGAATDRVLPSISREILAAGPAQADLRDAALRAIDRFSVLADRAS